jgi:hypothetical protein
VDGQKSAVHTELTDIRTNSFKFLLERGSLNILFELIKNLSDATVLSNDNANEPTFSSGYLGTREHDGGREIVIGMGMWVLSELIFLLLLLLSDDAVFE